MMRASTPVFKFVGYLETTGGPVCICPANRLNTWTGAENADGLYWDAIDVIGNGPIEKYKNNICFFLTETGNFTLWRNKNGLVIAEVVSVEIGSNIPWGGISFNYNPGETSPIALEGLIGFFDSTLTIDSVESECLIALKESAVWNVAFVKCDYSSYTEIAFADEKIVMQGVWFN